MSKQLSIDHLRGIYTLKGLFYSALGGLNLQSIGGSAWESNSTAKLQRLVITCFFYLPLSPAADLR